MQHFYKYCSVQGDDYAEEPAHVFELRADSPDFCLKFDAYQFDLVV